MGVINDKLTESKRIEWIDIAKGIGILFVVYGHINYAPGLIGPAIYAFHMPLFFILSGMVFCKDKYKSYTQYLKRDFVGLICPYIFFYLLSFFYVVVADIVQNGISSFELSNHLNGFIQMFIAQSSAAVVNSPLWFVPCLFFVKSVYYFISKLHIKLNVIICLALVCLGWIMESEYMPFKGLIIPWSIDSAFFALGFYALGNLLFTKTRDILEKKPRKYIYISVVLISAILVLVIAQINGNISLGSKRLGNGFLTYLSGIAGTCGVLALSVLLIKNKFLKFCGQNSFCIMATHYIIRNFIGTVSGLLGVPYDATSTVETIVPFVIVFALSMFCAVIYNKTKEKLTTSAK